MGANANSTCSGRTCLKMHARGIFFPATNAASFGGRNTTNAILLSYDPDGTRFGIAADAPGESMAWAGGDGNALPYDPTQLQNNKDINFDNYKDAQGNDHWYVAGGNGQELGYDPTKDGGQLNAVY